jgi:hypothetical protein
MNVIFTVIFREEYRLKVLVKWVARNTLGLKNEVVAECWRKLHNNVIHDLHYSPIVIQIKPTRTRLTNAWSRILFKRITVHRVTKKFPTLCGIRRIIIVFTTACRLFQS